MRYSLRQLEVFTNTAHHENISKAADRLAMSQSAASTALKEFESQFDIRLFERVGKRLVLNELGRTVLPLAQALLERGEELQEILERSGGEASGSLRVGATLSVGNYLVPGLISRFITDNPGARVQLEVANTATIVDLVERFELDVGLIEGEVSHPDLEIIPWREDRLVVFCAPQHDYASRKLLTEKDLRAAKWILREQGSGTRQAFDRALAGVMPELNVLMELQHTEAIKRSVEAGLGIGCLSDITLVEAFRRGSLVPLTVPGRNFGRMLYRVMHKQK